MTVQTGYRVLDVPALKAVGEADRGQSMLLFVDTQAAWYQFDEAVILTPDDDNVIAPDEGFGQWIKKTTSSSGGGGSSTPIFPRQYGKPGSAPPAVGAAIADIRNDRAILWIANDTTAVSDWKPIGGTIYLLNPSVTDVSGLNFFFPADYNGQMLVIRTTPTGRFVFIAFEGSWTQIYSGS